MILSVLKHTQSTVKFWFIENFLSPSFVVSQQCNVYCTFDVESGKEFLPHFAAEYKFEYELVTFKWPGWLRSQTDKQRMIWGYVMDIESIRTLC